MTSSNFSNTVANITLGLILGTTLLASPAWAACTSGSMLSGDASCVNTVNNSETGLATLNTDIATTNTNLATTNTNLATANTNVTAANGAMTSGDATTLTSAKTYADSQANGAATLASANAYTNTKTAEMTQSANAYTDKKSTEVVNSAAAYTSEQLQKVDQKTSRGIASTVAMANIPAPSSAGKTFTLGVGVGSYDKQTALAIGGQKRLGESGMARFAIAGSTGGGSSSSVSVGASASWEF